MKHGKLRIAWSVENASGYRSASNLAIGATVLFVALIMADAVSAFSMLRQTQLLESLRSGGTLSPGQAEATDAQQRLFAIIDLVLAFSATIALVVWVYRVNRNARAFGVRRMRYSPGWSVAWFFIPLASLIMPYRVLRELWQASTPGVGLQWRRVPVPSLLVAWWVA
jgi:hypothetical protein